MQDDTTPRPAKHRHAAALGALVAVFAVLAVLVALGAGGGLDARLYDWVVAHRRSRLDEFFTPFTNLGSWYIVAPVALLLAAGFAAARRRREAALLVLAPLCALVLNVVLKLIVHRAPPGGDDDDLVAHARYSFPSGHTMTTTALAAALVLIAWPTRWRWPVAAGAVVVAATMGVSRVYVGVHHPSDVVAGWLMGAATAGLVWLALGRPPRASAAGEAGAAGAAAAPVAGPSDTATGPPATTDDPDIRVVLFDWGDTLMVDDGQPGRMADWPRVAAVPGAAAALAALHGRYRLCVATNADDSGAEDVMAALGRVGLARFIDRVFSSRDVGARKPDPAFYAAVLEGLRSDEAAATGTSPHAVAPADPPLRADQVVMVGDSYANDVAGATAAGLRAVWLSAGREAPSLHADELGPAAEILGLAELPDILRAPGI